MTTPNTVPALLALRGRPRPYPGLVDPAANEVVVDGRRRAAADLDWDPPDVRCVYGAALNSTSQRRELDASFRQPPYQSPPVAPVLYIKPRNTWLGHRVPLIVPSDVEEVALGPTLGIVFARDAHRVSRDAAPGCIAGFTIVNDLSIPHTSLFRPPLRFNARDGFCPLGPWVVPRDALTIDSLELRALVNGEVRQSVSTADLHRDVAQLIADVSEFMTLGAGDLLTIGVAANAPRARAGDRIAIEIEGLGRLENELVASTADPRPGRAASSPVP
jgi:5-oxopent-3-ene-1,2,5-tricarboxylate decarboxylase/2-hydroxyhepta-2,4-diene-1,7-dioate isomerase